MNCVQCNCNDWFKISAWSYLFTSIVLGITCCAWTWDLYTSDTSDAAFSFSVIGSLCCALIILGLCAEFVKHKFNKTCCSYLDGNGLGMRLAHAGMCGISMFSTCVAAVIIANESTTGLYTLSFIVIGIQFLFCLCCIPCNYLILLFDSYEEQHKVIKANQYLFHNFSSDHQTPQANS